MSLNRLFMHAWSFASALVLCSNAAFAAPRQSSPIALTSDGQRLVCTNPDAGTVTLFDVSTDVPRKLAEIQVGREPSSVAIHPDGRRAYVANALDGAVGVLDLATRRRTRVVRVGAEPMALCLSPSGTRLYVANSASNNLMVFDTKPAAPRLLATIDLGASGTAPRAIAVTDNGDSDDSDETVFVAMFYASLRPGKTPLQEGQDDEREGHVVAISAGTNQLLDSANPIVLSPLANSGFNANGALAPATGLTPAVPSTNPQTFTTPTGAFPNQLAALALHPTRPLAFVVSTGASPNGPLRFNGMAQGLVSVFDTAVRTELTSAQTGASVRRTAPLNLNQGINLSTTPAPRLFLTNPVAMTWRPDGSDAWALIQNSDLVVRLTLDANGIPSISAPLVAGPSTIVRVDLENPPAGHIPGKAPRGIVINAPGSRAYVTNYVSRSISVVDISNPTSPAIVGTALSTRIPKPGSVEDFVLLGAELFHSGRGPQGRLSSESWGGCIVCHPAGRSDNVTWMFDTGPRQTIPLDGVFDPKAVRHGVRLSALPWQRGGTDLAGHDVRELVLGKLAPRILNWSGVRDETQDFELNTRGVFGGRGLIDDDRLFITFGGTSGATPTDLNSVQQFQQFTGAISTTNDLAGGATLPLLPSPRRDFALASTGDGRIFIIGGRSGAGNGTLLTGPGTVLEFDSHLNTFRVRNEGGFTPRHSLGAAAIQTRLGPRIYAIGGYAATDPAIAPSILVQEFNPDANTWRQVASLPTAVAQFGITSAGGINTAEPLQLLHVVCGNTNSESTPSVANPNPVQRFQADPVGPGTWSAFSVAGLTLRRNHGAAVALRGVQSRIFVLGGQDAGGTVLSSVEEYLAQAVVAVGTPHTPINISNSATPTPRARFGIASSLSTNQIYVVGGIDGTGTDQAAVLEYSPNSNDGLLPGPPGTPSGTWVNRGSLAAPARALQVSLPPGVTNLLPFASSGRDERQDAIAAYVALGIRSALAPVSVSDPAARRGRALFSQKGLVVNGFSCATCHGGPKWTRSAVDYSAPPSPEVGLGLGNERVIGAELRQTATQSPAFPNVGQAPGVLVNVGTFSAGGRQNEIRVNAADPGQAIAPLGANGFNIPSLLSVHETAPYFYSGLAQTLENVLDGSQDGTGGTRQHLVADPQKRADLATFLRSIDTATPPFP